MEPLLNKNYIVIKKASRHSGYSVDYLMRLCRAGRIQGTQVGRTWLVRRSSLEQFVRAQEEKKREMGRELSKVREQEYKQTQAPKSATFIPLVKATIEKKVNESPRLAEIHPILRPAFALAVTVLVLTASVWAADSGFITRLGGGVIASALRSQDAGPVIPEKTAYALVTVGEYAERGLTALVTGTPAAYRGATLALASTPRQAAAAAAFAPIQNDHGIGERLAVATYRTVTNFFSSFTRQLAVWFGISTSRLTIVPFEVANTLHPSTDLPVPHVAVGGGVSYGPITEHITNVTSINGASVEYVNAYVDAYVTNALRGLSARIGAQVLDGQGVHRSSTASSATSANSVTNGTISNSVITNSSFTGGDIIADSLQVNGNTTITGTTTISGPLVIGGLNGITECLHVDANGVVSGTGSDCGSGGGGGITGVRAQYSTIQTGATQTFATSSDANIGLTITSAGNTHTFTPVWTGVLSVARGGLGLSSVTANGLLIGNSAGTGYTTVATTSLGLSTSDISEGANLYYTLSRFAAALAGTTTDALAEGVVNRYYTDARARNAFSATATGLTYTAGTGVLSLTSGYEIPLSASTSNWQSFYTTPSSRITAGTNLSWVGNTLNGPTDSYIRALLTATSPLAYDNTTGTFSIQQANGSQSGYLSSTDWTTFNTKFATTSTNYWLSTKTTDSLAQGSVNLYYDNALVATFLNTIAKEYFFSTSSADYWKSQRDLFSTTSASYFLAQNQGAAFSTTSSDFWLTTKTTDNLAQGATNKYYNDSLVNTFIGGSTTIPKTYTNNVFTGGNIFGLATVTSATTTNLNIVGTITGAGLTSCSLSSSKLLWDSATGQFSCGADAGAGGGITALKGQYSTAQTGSTQTFATTSDTNIGLTITSAGDTHTFSPVWIGTLAAARGGTGLSSIASSSILIGGAGNTITQMATSTLGLESPLTFNTPLSRSGNAISIQVANGSQNGYLSSTDWNTFNNKVSSTSLSATYPVQYNSGTGVFSLAFGTTTSNTWAGTQTFTNAPVLGALNGLVGANNGSLYQIATATNFVTSLIGGTGINVSGATGAITITNTGVTAIAQSSGTNQTGTITLATSTVTANGQTHGIAITNSTGTFTFTPTISGTLGVAGGGTGAASFTAGQILYGNGTNALSSVATTTETLGSEFSYTGTLGSLVGGTSGTLSLATNGVALTKIAQIGANTILGNNTGATGNVVAFATSTLFGTGTGGQVLAISNGVPTWIASTTYANGSGISTVFAAGQLTITNTGLLSLQQLGGGSAQTGAITFATSSNSSTGLTLGLNITNTSGAFTFTPTLSGTLNVANGGTGLSSIASSSLLIGGAGNTILAIATSSLGLENPLTFSAPLSRTGNTVSLPAANGSTNGYLSLTDWTTFNNKISSTSLSATYPLAYNSSTGVFTTAFGTTTTNTYSALNTFNAGILARASSTIGDGTAAGGLTVSGTATTSDLYVTGTLRGAGLTSCSLSSSKLLWDSVTGQFTCGADAGAGGGITAIKGQYSAAQTGSTQTFATGSDANIGLTITSAGDTHTFTPTWSGTLSVARGGTGLGSTPSYGQVLLGNGSGYTLTATSSLGLESPLTFNSPLTRSGNAISIQQANGSQNGYLSLTDWTTFNNKISSTSLSATYPLAYNSATGVFSTAFGTTTTNTYSGANTFNGGVTIGSLSGVLYGTSGVVNSAATGTVSSGTGISVTGNQYIIGSGLTITNTGVTSVAQSFGTNQTGAITLASSTVTANGQTHGITITNSTGTFTFTPTISGTLNVAGGGTGVGSFTAGQLIYGNGTNNLTSVGTTTETLSSEFAYSGTLGALVGGSSGTLSLATNGIALTKLAQVAANTILGNNTGATGNVVAFATSTLFGTGTGGQVLAISGGVPTWIASTTYSAGSGISTAFAAGNLTITNTGLLSLQQLGGGSAQTGAITFATSSATNNGVTIGLNITNTAGAFTFTTTRSGTLTTAGGGTGFASYTPGDFLYADTATSFARVASSTDGFILALANGKPTWVASTTLSTISGTLAVAKGGTGTTTAPSGQIIYGGGSGVYQSVGTSSLAVSAAFNYSGTLGSLIGGSNVTLSLNTNNPNTWTALQTFSAGASSTQISAATGFFNSVLATSSSATSTFAGGFSAASSLYVLQGGKVGIGTAAPGTTLDVVGTSRVSSTFTLSSVTSCTGAQALQTNGSGDISCGNIATGGASSGGGWTTNNVGVISLSTTTDKVVIGASTTPYAKLAVISGSAATTTLAILPASGQTANIVDIYNANGLVNSVINSSGFLGLATTSPTQQLSVQGNGLFSGNIALANLTATGTVSTANLTVTGVTSSLLSTDGSGVVQSTSVSSPLSFSGSTLSIANAVANGSTKGAATFLAADFNDDGSGGISIDYTNGQKANGSQPGFLAAADWTVFNNKISSTSLSAVYPLAYNSATGVFSTAFGTTTANTFSALNTFNGGVTIGTLSGVVYGNNGSLTSVATSTVANGTGISVSGSAAVVGAGGLTITNTGLLSLQQLGGGSAQTGAITFATSSQTTNGQTIGLNITNTSGAFTFSPTISGTLTVAGGGTGLTSVADGALVYGSGGSTLNALATSTSGKILQLDFTTGRPTWVATSTLGLVVNAITSIGPVGQGQTGPAITIASSSSTTNGLTSAITITAAGNTITYAPTLSGTLTVAGGGTGQSSLSSGQILYGAGTGAVQSVATGTVSSGTGISVTGNQYIIGSGLTITNTGVTSVAQSFGTNQTGAITFASSTVSANGQTHGIAITNSTGTFTFTPTISGTLNVAGGGTGLTTVADGSLVFGSGGTTLTALASSTGGFLTNSYTTGRPVWSATSTLNVALADTTGTLAANRGGTGFASYTPGDILYADTSSSFARVGSTTDGFILGLANGKPTWVATTTLSSITGTLAIAKGGTGTTTAPVGQLIYGGATAYQSVGTSTVANGTGISVSGSAAVVGAGGLTITNTGLLSLQQLGGGSAQTGAITFATSSNATTGLTLGLNITNSSGAFTFTPTLAGTLNVANGGTGQTSFTSSQLIYGNGANGLLSVATTSETLSSEFSFSGTYGSRVGGTSGTLSLATNGVAYSKLAQAAANTILGNPTGATGNIQAFATSSLGIALTDTTGTLSIARGGTGTTTAPQGQLIYGGATSYQSVATGTVSSGTGISVTGNQYIIGSGLTITNTGVTSVAQSFGTNQTGAITLATSSAVSFNGLTFTNSITNSSGTFTFTPALSGTLGVAGGGTGVGTFTAGQLIYGNGTNNLTSVGTTSETLSSEFSFSGTYGARVGGTSGTLSLATNGVAYSKLAQAAANTILGNNTGATGNVVAFATSSLGIALADTTGTLSIARGGTGTTTAPSGQIIYGGGAGVYQSVSTSTVANGTGISVSGSAAVVGAGGLTITNTGLLSLQQLGGGSAQTGAITFATSSQTTNGQTIGLNITNTSGAFTFSPTIGGTLTVAGGGTGATSLSSGQLIYGAGTGAVQSVATTSIAVSGAFSYSGTLGSLVGGANGTLSLATNGVALTNLAQIAANSVLVNNTSGTGNVVAIATSTFYGLGTGGQVLTWNNGVPQWVATTTYSAGSGISTSFAAGNLTINNTGLLSLQQLGGGSAQTGAITFATSSNSSTGLTLGLNITNTSGAFTFTPTLGGTLNVGNGGTGATSFTAGSLVYGAGTGALQSVATTTATLGLGLSGTLTTLNSGGTQQLSVATSSLYTGTTGQFPYFSGTNTITATSTLFLATNGNIGVNSTTPRAQFTISAVNTTLVPLEIWGPSGSGPQAVFRANNAVNSWGNGLIQVGGVTNGSSGLRITFNDKDGQTTFNDGNSDTEFINSNGSFLRTQGQGIILNFSKLATAAGYVGIGTTTPATNLSLQGNGLFSGNLSVAGFTATGTATVGNLTVGSLTGPLQAINGVVSATSTLSVFYGGTGTSTIPTFGKVLVGNSQGGYDLRATSTLGFGAGSVTSVDASGGTTGLSFSGGPITTFGTLTLSGTLGVANGGTGSTTLTGLLKGNGAGQVQTAVAGTDYQAPITAGTGLSFSGNTLNSYWTLNGSNNLYNNNSGTRVGIATNTPAYPLDVGGFINVAGIGGYKQNGKTILYASSTNSSTLVGADAGIALTSAANYAVAVGNGALQTSQSAQFNTAVGYQALNLTTTGAQNTTLGAYTLANNSTGASNVAIGYAASYFNAFATNTVAIGNEAANGAPGYYANQGSVAIGYRAGYNFMDASDYNTLLGFQAGLNITSGARNIIIGADTTGSNSNLDTGSNNISIGNNISLPDNAGSNQLNIGNLIFGTGLSGTGSTISTGNIGIGTTSPYGKLSVVGNVVAANFIATTSASSTFAGPLSVSNLAITSNSGILKASAGGYIVNAVAGTDYLTSASAVTSISQTGGGSAQTGAITFATSSVTSNGVTIGLNITNSAGAFTFTPTRSGTLTVAGGGTGVGSFTAGQLIYGNGTNNLTSVATTSATLGLGLSGTLTTLNAGGTQQLSIATSSLYTGTAGQVAYFSGTNSLVGTSTLFVNTNSTVGIGTVTPVNLLDVYGGTNAPAVIRITTGSTGNAAVASFTLESTNGSSQLFKTSTGYAGYKTILANDLGFYNSVQAGNISILNDYASGKILFTAGGSSLAQFAVDSTGNVGVGTTSPFAKLSIHAFNGQTNKTLFAIGSSTASATTTLFGVDNNARVFSGTNAPSGYAWTLAKSYSGENDTGYFGITGQLNSTSANIYGIAYTGGLVPNTGSATTIGGALFQPLNTSINGTVTTMFGVGAGAASIVGTGVVTNGMAFNALAPTHAAANPFANYSHFAGAVITNGNGTTTGIVNNYGVNILAATAAAGSGGTINNYAAMLNVPTGTGAGTTNNYGLYLNGTGGGANAWSLYNNSASNSYFAGSVGVGSTSPFAKLSVHANNGETNRTLFAIGSSTASATTTLFSISNTGSTTAVNGFNITAGCFAVNGTCLATSGTNYWSLSGNNLTNNSGTYIGIGSSTPWGQLSVNPNALGSGIPEFVVGSSTGTNFIVGNDGRVGVGTTSPWAQFSINPNNIGASPILAIGSSTGTSFMVANNGRVAVGSTSPYARLSIHANNGDTHKMLFAVGSSTAAESIPFFSISNTGNVGIGGTNSTNSGFTQLTVTAGTSTITRIGQANLSGARNPGIWVQGRYAYIVQGGNTTNGLEIFDVSTSTPSFVSRIDLATGNNAAYQGNDIIVQGRYAYVVEGYGSTNAFEIFDVSNPNRPTRISQSDLAYGQFWTNKTIEIQGRYAYILGGGQTTSALEIFDISNPAAPVRISQTNITNGGQTYSDMHVQGRYAYIVEGSGTTNAFEIFDVSNPAVPVRVGQANLANTTNLAGTSIFVQGSYAYIVEAAAANGFEIFDISDPTAPIRLSQTTTLNSGAGGTNPDIWVQGRYAYIAGTGTTNAFEVYDISNPAAPMLVSRKNLTVGGANAMYIQGRYAYIAQGGTTNAFEVFDLGGAYIQQLETGGIETTSLAVRGNLYAMDGNFQGGLTVERSLAVTGASSFVAASSTHNTATGIFNVTTASSTSSIISALGNGRVGIGSTTPFAKLSISANFGETNTTLFAIGSSTSASATTTLFTVLSTGQVNIPTGSLGFPGLSFVGDTTTGIYRPTASALGVIAGGTESFRVTGVNAIIRNDGVYQFATGALTAGGADAGLSRFGAGVVALGNGTAANTSGTLLATMIGLGTTTPFGALQIGTTTGKNLVLSDTAAGTNLKHWLFSSHGGNLYIGTTTDLYATSTPAFTLLGGTGSNAGYFGLGTSSPFSKLSVSGASSLAKFKSTTNVANALSVENAAGSNVFQIDTLDTNGSLFTIATSTGTSYMEVTSAGNIGIGTSTPGAKFDIYNGALCVDDSTPTCQNAARTAGTIYAVATSITGIDIAESYPTKDGTLAAGQIVVFDPANPVFVKRAHTGAQAFLGVVSTAPGIVLGGYNDELYAAEHKVPIALAGRVPVTVNMEGGSIAVGDLITLSSVDGVGKKATESGQTIGIALESATGAGTIQVFIKPEYSFIPTQFALNPTTGNVGIGVATPSQKLEVAGNGLFNGSVTASHFNALGAGTSTLSRLAVSNAFTLGSQYLTSFTGTGLALDGGILSIASSTFANLHTQGGNSFGTTSVIGTRDTNDITFITASTTRLTITADGKVGIGTTTPNHALQVVGDIGAIGFVNTSTRTAKTDITYLTASTTENILERIQAVRVARYHYKIEDDNEPLRLGLIAEEAPYEVLSADGKGVDVYKLASFTLAGVQALAHKVDTIEEKVASIDERLTQLQNVSLHQATTTDTNTDVIATTTGALQQLFRGVGALIQNGVAQFNTLVARQFVASKDADGTSSAGAGTILTGNTSVEVTNKIARASSKIFVTFTSPVDGGWYLSEKKDGSFRVVLKTAATEDVTFDYFIVQTEGQLASPESLAGTPAPEHGPTITLNGASPYYVAVGESYAEPGANAFDGSGATIEYNVAVDGQTTNLHPQLDTSAPRTFTITYTAFDSHGSFSTKTRTVIVAAPGETTPPAPTPEGGSTEPPVPPEVPPGELTSEPETPPAPTDTGTTTPDA